MIEFLKSIFFTADPDSKQFSWNLKDFWKGLITSVFTVPVTVVLESVLAWANNPDNSVELVMDWKSIFKMAVVGFISYMMKNFFTRSK